MIVAVGYYAAALMQDVNVSLGTFGCVGHQFSTGATAPAGRDGQHTHTGLPHERLRPSSTTIDGSRGGWLWTNRLSSTRCGAAGAVQGCVAAPGAALPPLVYAAEVGAVR
jgi:hypothetical protein